MATKQVRKSAGSAMDDLFGSQPEDQPVGDDMAISPVSARVLDAAVEIMDDDPDTQIGFLHSTLAMCGLPYHKPPKDQTEYIRKNGKASLLITSGKLMDPNSGEWAPQGLPYGARSRLILVHLCTEAIRTRTKVIEVGNSMCGFMKTLGIEPTGGKKGTIGSFKEQVNRLAAARLQIGTWTHAPGGHEQAVTVNAQPFRGVQLLSENPGHKVLWSPTVELETEFFESLLKFAVPLEYRAVAAIKHSPMALDVYSWLANRLHRVKDPSFISWDALYLQFGGGYARMVDFRRKFLATLQLACTVYPQAKLELVDGKGIRLFNSPPPIAKRLIAVKGVDG
tara:strand:- start:1209 stop:2219 length:1011 start_codon:yes stop_codon:yes gene_type:complete